MTYEEAKQYYTHLVKFESINLPPTTGQSCGMIYAGQRLICDELDIMLECGFERSVIKNRKHLMLMFEAFLNEIIK